MYPMNSVFLKVFFTLNLIARIFEYYALTNRSNSRVDYKTDMQSQVNRIFGVVGVILYWLQKSSNESNKIQIGIARKARFY